MLVNRSDLSSDTLAEMEKAVYMPFNQMSGYSEKHEPNDIGSLVRERGAFCSNHGYGLHSEDELLFEVGDSNIDPRWYVEDFIERWDRIAQEGCWGSDQSIRASWHSDPTDISGNVGMPTP